MEWCELCCAKNAKHASLRAPNRFIDGSKSSTGRYRDLATFRGLSNKNATFFFDDLASEKCINGTFDQWSKRGLTGEMVNNVSSEWRQHCIRQQYAETMHGYNRAARDGIFRVGSCAWPVKAPRDGICMGHVL